MGVSRAISIEPAADEPGPADADHTALARRTGRLPVRGRRPRGRPAGRRPGPGHDLTGRLRRGVGDRPRTRVGQGVRHPPVRHERQADAHPWHRRPARCLRRRDRDPRGQAAVDRRRRHRPLRPDGHGHRGDPTQRVVPGRRAGPRRHARRRRHAGAPAPRHPPPDAPGAQRGSHPRRSTPVPPRRGRRRRRGRDGRGRRPGAGAAVRRRPRPAPPSSSRPLRRPRRPCRPRPSSASRA